MGRRILRYRIGSDGTLTDREVFGPDPLGEDLLPDGIAIDADGNLWVAMVTRNGLMVVAADGTTHTVFEDPNEAGLAALRTAYASGFIELPTILACKGESIAALTSIGFGGPDLKTIFMGSLAMPYLLSFRSPVPGLPLRHQDLPKPPPQPETELAHLEDDSDRT